jgi:hypothetical protein
MFHLTNDDMDHIIIIGTPCPWGEFFMIGVKDHVQDLRVLWQTSSFFPDPLFWNSKAVVNEVWDKCFINAWLIWSTYTSEYNL